MSKYTPEQQAAIQSTGKTIVSASAGSGKTTVMIEKIINLIRSGCDVKSILAVTFTKKAASQMKEKLGKALIKEINTPDVSVDRKRQLKMQLNEVASADISTIHSFCAKFIRSHFYAADVDNAFRVIGGDDAEGTALKSEALNQVLEEGYTEKDVQFTRLLSTYWRKKSDGALRKILLSVYESLRNRADYKEYLERTCAYNESTFDEICADLHALLKEKCAYYLGFVLEEKAYFEGEKALPQIALATELETLLNSVLATDNYFAACAVQKPKFTANRKGKTESAEKLLHIERLAAIKGKITPIFDEELSEIRDRATELERFLQSGEIATAFAQYLLKFDAKYAELKRERGVLDYNDLEHKALELLRREEIVEELRQKYQYVFVDEYQDVNPVQEAIVSAVGGENVFLVGDVKQSIYGFRGSQSKFFVEKQRQFAQNGGSSLKMTRNFRSSDAVLDAVNAQFSLAMTPHTSQVDYAHDSYMEKGGRYAVNSGRVVLHRLFDGDDSKEKSTEKRGVYSVRANANKREVEESVLAKAIRAIIDEEVHSTWFDADDQEQPIKPVRYSDIAVLSRKKQGQIAKTVAALADNGIPVSSVSAVNICEFSEIKTLIDILSLLDNAEQDVPLCSALLSPVGDLTADELANIRLAYPNEKFFRLACQKYAGEQTDKTAYKLKLFYEYFQTLRTLTCVMDAGEILLKILMETRMETLFMSRPNGQATIRRIHRFIEATTQGESLSVHDFLNRLRDLDYKIECMENGGENSIKVLTMHSSKGLEYPIVIVDNLNAPFRGVDKEDVFVEEKFGLAPRAFDDKKMLRYDTLLRRLHEQKDLQASIADELNLYYVALTRAKFGLHMTYSKSSVFPDVKYARSFADFTNFKVWEQYAAAEQYVCQDKQPRQAMVFRPNEGLVREIMSAFTWKYAFGGCENLPVKSSATALMSGQGIDVVSDDVQPKIPDKAVEMLSDSENMVEGDAATSVQAGLSYHAFLERFDFGLLYDETGARIGKEQLRALVERACVEYGDCYLSVDKLMEILSNEVFYQFKDMRLYKEQKFLVSLPAKETFLQNGGGMYAMNGEKSQENGVQTDEEILFQGAIDLLAVGEKGAWIIDYKYSRRGANSIRQHYQPQLDLYRRTVAKILQLDASQVRCSIVNIYHGYQVDL